MTSDRETKQTAAVELGRGPAPDSILAGTYRVETTLGFGGMGQVLLAHHIAHDEKVALKILRDDVAISDEHIQRFIREAKAAVQLRSENVARIRDVGTLENGRPYMAMELLDGVDLGRLLLDQECIDRVRAVNLILQACDAIAEAHAIGIVHRDIKPTNLFLTRNRDGGDLLKVLDFGISKAVAGPELSLTQTSSMLGTPAYMSPEQLRSARTADPRNDIWALGVVLYELVEGHPPFDARNFADLCIIVSTEPPQPMTNAPELQPVITRCLEKSADRRYQNVGELAADLEAFAPDPARARQQVARMQRVLGVPSRPALRTTAPRVAAAPLPATPTFVGRPDEPAPGGSWKLVLLLVTLFALGIAAGLVVTSL